MEEMSKIGLIENRTLKMLDTFNEFIDLVSV